MGTSCSYGGQPISIRRRSIGSYFIFLHTGIQFHPLTRFRCICFGITSESANEAHAHLWRGYAFAVQQPNALVALAGALGDGPLPGLRPTAPSPHHQRALVLRNANSRAVVSPRTHRLRAWSVRLSEL